MKKRSNFTLIELLMVMLIMGALTVISVPVFRQLVGGKAVEHAAMELAARVAFARGYAVSHHTYVAILFPKFAKNRLLQGKKADTGIATEKYVNCSYRTAVVRRNGGNYTFVSWLPESKWNFLPKGVIVPSKRGSFDYFGWQKGNDRNELYQMDDPEPENPPDYLKVDTNNSVPTVVNVDWTDFVKNMKSSDNDGMEIERCIIFKPDGQMVSADKKHFLIYLTEAVYDPEDVETSNFLFLPKNPTYRGDDKTGPVRSDYTILDLNPISGKIRYHHLNALFYGYEG